MAKEKSILLSTDQVKAILEDQQNVIRRVIKEIPPYYQMAKKPQSYGPDDYCFIDMADPTGTYPTLAEPRYQVGDLLWIKETFGIVSKNHPLIKQTLPMFEYTHYSKTEPDCIQEGYELLYKATQEIDPDFPIRWRSPLLMPKWAARTWLEVLDVRPERLQGDSSPWAWRYKIKIVNRKSKIN